MVSIRLKNYNRAPKRLLSTGCKKQIRRAAVKTSGAVCSGNYFRDDSIRKLLKAYSIGKRKLLKKDKPKCFYCESQGEAMLTLEVEHFRPKDGLNPIDLTAGQIHNGYYWLGNEWSNLLLSCRACNGGDAKGVRFPITNNGNRVFHDQPVNAANILNRNICKLNSSRLLPEAPVLINPEFDTPENHLTFDHTGQICHQPGSIRGQRTIEILRLNRDPLLIARQDILNDFINDIRVLIEARRINRIANDAQLEASLEPIFRKIISRTSVVEAYTLWGRYINANIENLVVSKVPNTYRQILRDAYQYVINNP